MQTTLLHLERFHHGTTEMHDQTYLDNSGLLFYSPKKYDTTCQQATPAEANLLIGLRNNLEQLISINFTSSSDHNLYAIYHRAINSKQVEEMASSITSLRSKSLINTN